MGCLLKSRIFPHIYIIGKAYKFLLYRVVYQGIIDDHTKWCNKKQLILPTVVGDDIVPVALTATTIFKEGDFHIMEPQNAPYDGDFDLIIVPGVAFDRLGNRLGRGRGYYDRFLAKHLSVKRIGICFDFQLVDEIPTEPTDIKMHAIISL